MATSGGQGGERSVDDFTMYAALIGGTLLLVWIAWYMFHTELSMAYTYVRRAQLWWIDLIGQLGVPGAQYFSKWFANGCAAGGILEPCTRDFSSMQWVEITNLSYYVNILLLPVILFVAFRIFMHIQEAHPDNRFNKKFTVDTYVREKKRIYRHLRMFDSLKLIETPLDDPVLGMSQTSRQFAFAHRLIIENNEGGGWLLDFTPVLDKKKAEHVLKLQLGSLWTAPGDLKKAEVMLLAAVIPRVAATDGALNNEDFKKCLEDSDKVVDWCWDQFTPPKPQEKGSKTTDDPLAWLKPNVELEFPLEIIKKYLNTVPVQEILVKHAYVQTIFFAMFVSARSLGVFQPAEFRWLRFYDRTLWYVLENIGRQAAFAEGSAAHSHYYYEIKLKKALPTPQVGKAVEALEAALTAFQYSKADKDAYEEEGRALKAAIKHNRP